MAQQKIVIANIKSSIEQNIQETELPSVNEHLSKGYYIKSWQTSVNHINDVVTLTILLEKIEQKATPGVKFGLESKNNTES